MRSVLNFEKKTWFPKIDVINDFFSKHSKVYRVKHPIYQRVLLESLSILWPEKTGTVLDVGAGNGLVSMFIKKFFPVSRVVSIDVVDRVLPLVDIDFSIYDGKRIPFQDSFFDGVVLVNVLHHVSKENRDALMKEIVRVCCKGGFVLIKDHVAKNMLDRFRLYMMDAIGNVPFSGMVEASYLSMSDWQLLFSGADVEVSVLENTKYRGSVYSLIFPNRLEVMFKLTVGGNK